jgi:hypothetical protein
MEGQRIKQNKVGDILCTIGEKIAFIVGQTNKAGVFLTEEGFARWEWYEGEKVPTDLKTWIGKFGNLAYYLRASVPKKRRRNPAMQLATALYSALHSENPEERAAVFAPVEQEIAAASRVSSSFRYICGSIATAIVSALIMWIVTLWTPAENHFLCFGAIAGGFGASISVLIRAHTLSLERTAPLWGAALQGATRTVLGVAFGVVMVVAIKCELVLAFFKESLYGMFVSGIMAGFSERAVPELPEGLAEKAKTEYQAGGAAQT